MADKRFYGAEHAILIAYFKLRDYPSAQKLARTAGVSRATLYRHHHKIQAIPVDYEKYLLRNYSKAIKRFLDRDATPKTLVLRTLVFIACNREMVQILFKSHHQDIIEKMFDRLKPQITQAWHSSDNLDKMYSVYQNEVLGIIKIWSKTGFSDKELGPTLDNILYLTQSAHRNLSPLR